MCTLGYRSNLSCEQQLGCGVSVVVGDNNFLILIIIPAELHSPLLATLSPLGSITQQSREHHTCLVTRLSGLCQFSATVWVIKAILAFRVLQPVRYLL